MVERIARSMFWQERRNDYDSWERLVEYHKEMWLRRAQNALNLLASHAASECASGRASSDVLHFVHQMIAEPQDNAEKPESNLSIPLKEKETQ